SPPTHVRPDSSKGSSSPFPHCFAPASSSLERDRASTGPAHRSVGVYTLPGRGALVISLVIRLTPCQARARVFNTCYNRTPCRRNTLLRGLEPLHRTWGKGRVPPG